MEHGASLFEKATFVMDRGYDDNKMFLKMDKLNQILLFVLQHEGNFFITISGHLPQTT